LIPNNTDIQEDSRQSVDFLLIQAWIYFAETLIDHWQNHLDISDKMKSKKKQKQEVD